MTYRTRLKIMARQYKDFPFINIGVDPDVAMEHLEAECPELFEKTGPASGVMVEIDGQQVMMSMEEFQQFITEQAAHEISPSEEIGCGEVDGSAYNAEGIPDRRRRKSARNSKGNPGFTSEGDNSVSETISSSSTGKRRGSKKK